MAFMEVVPWALVVVLVAVVVFLLTREKPVARAPAVGGAVDRGPDRTASDAGGAADAGGPAQTGAAVPSEGATTTDASSSTASREELTRELLVRVLDYLERSPLARLRAAEEEFDLPAPAADALDALEDLAFYGSTPSGNVSRQNLAHVVQDVTREYSSAHGLRVRVIGPERPVIFEVADEWLKDIVYLVVANAHHFGDGEGVEVRLSGGQAVPALIEVRDHGEGFDDEALEHAFDPFWTTDPSAPGLGLFHCRMLVDRMGGQLELGNHPEGGGRVRILLPAEPPAGES